MEVARSTYFVVFFGGGGGGGFWNVGRFGLPPRKGGFSGGGVGLVGGTFCSGMALFAGYFRKVLSCSYVSVAFLFLCTCKQVVFFKFLHIKLFSNERTESSSRLFVCNPFIVEVKPEIFQVPTVPVIEIQHGT